MCRRVSCSDCGRPTFAGCGAHVEQVLGDVPTAQRCQCREQKRNKPPKQPDSVPRPSWLRALLGGKR